jgi:hypothetical protein
MPMSTKQLRERDFKRDVGAELVQAVRDLNAGKGNITARVLKGMKSGALNSLQTITAFVEPSLAQAKADDKPQIEWHGYFVADRVDHKGGKLV